MYLYKQSLLKNTYLEISLEKYLSKLKAIVAVDEEEEEVEDNTKLIEDGGVISMLKEIYSEIWLGKSSVCLGDYFN